MGKKDVSFKKWCIENNKELLLEEWDFDKNKLIIPSVDMDDVSYNSSNVFHWVCTLNHKWESTILARTIYGLSCPICNESNFILKKGTKHGCLTIVEGFEEYRELFAFPVIEKLEQARKDFLCGKPNTYTNFTSVETFDTMIEKQKMIRKYKCQCKCGLFQYLDEAQFFERKRRYCVHGSDECGLRKEQKKKLESSYRRVLDKSYNVDLADSFHESLHIIECVDENYEELSSYSDKRSYGGGTFKVYKKYKCVCYLCSKEHIFRSSDFSVNPPSSYGKKAYGGYYSDAKCDCHKISSFQWIVVKILKEKNLPYRVEESFENLYGIYKTNLLRFDFAVLDKDGRIKCLIECQGEQHFKPIEEFGGVGQFKIQQENDKLKRDYAEKNNIPFYELSYKNKKHDEVKLKLIEYGII